MKKTRAAMILNFIIAGLTVMASVMMMSRAEPGETLASRGLDALKYFTVESNVLMGIVALITAFIETDILKGKREKLSRAMNVIKLVATSAVTLTLMVVIVFLAPQFGGLAALIAGSNLYFHLIIPLLSIITFTVFERSGDINFPRMLYALIPTALYGTGYAFNALGHAVDGKVPRRYDWYGFVAGGTKFAAVAFTLMMLASFVISLLLWIGNRRRKKA